MPIPQKILNAPLINVNLLFYYTSFFELCSERGKNGYIGILAIQNYAINLGLKDDDYDLFLFHIRGMDAKYREIRGVNGQQSSKPGNKNEEA